MNPTSAVLERTREEIGNASRSLPAWRRTLGRAQGLMNDPNASVRDIAALIESDPTLTARILSQANSAAYAGVVKIKSVERAIVRLGMVSVRNFFLTAMLKDVLELKQPVLEEVYGHWWKHSLACAMLCRSIANHVDRSDLAQDAYMAGLLHDLGVVTVLQAIDKLCSQPGGGDDLDSQTVCEVAIYLHSEVGGTVLRQMEFSDEIAAIAEIHEEAEADEDPSDVLTSIVVVANVLLRKVGLSIRPNPGLSVTNLPATGFLNLDPVFIASQEVEVEDALEHLDRLVS